MKPQSSEKPDFIDRCLRTAFLFFAAGALLPTASVQAVNFSTVITAVSPNPVTAGSSTDIQVTGQNFCPGAAIYFVQAAGQQQTGTALPTTFQSDTSLVATIPASLVPNANSNSAIYENNPAGGGCDFPGNSAEFSLPVGAAGVVVTSATLPSGNVGIPYQTVIAASGGTGPYQFFLYQPSYYSSLPPGLTLNSNGTIAGTPTSSGSYTFSVYAVDQNRQSSPPVSFEIDISPTSLTSLSPSSVMLNSPGFLLTLQGAGICPGATATINGSDFPVDNASNSQGQVNVPASVVSSTTLGPLPPGSTKSLPVFLTTPLQESNCFGFGRSNTLNLTVTGALEIQPQVLATGFQNSPYSQMLQAVSATAPVTFAISQGSLPPGITLDSASGLISGTTTQPGGFAFTVRATDANQNTATRDYVLQILSSVQFTGTTPGSIVAGTYANPVPLTLQGQGFCRSTQVSFDGTILQGDGTNGTSFVTSVPVSLLTTARIVTIAVDNSSCPTRGTASRPFTISSSSTGLTIAPATLPSAVQGQSYSQVVSISGGTAPYTVTLTGALPTGIVFSNLQFSGTPTQSGSFPITLAVQDSASSSASQSYTLLVQPGTGTALSLSPVSISTALQGQSYTQAFTASGGTPPYVITLTGTLPTGLFFNGTQISGIPTQTGLFPITVTVMDARQTTVSRDYSLLVSASGSLSIAPTTLPGAAVGSLFSQTFSATGGTAPYTFRLTGSLPSGLSFQNGILTGTPTQSGSFPFSITATDSGNLAAFQNYTLTVSGGIVILPNQASLTAVAGAAFSQVFSVIGGIAPYTLSLSGTLPSGLTFNGSTLAGTTSQLGSFPLLITATDSNQQTASRAYTLSVVSPVTVSPNPLPPATTGVLYNQPITISGGVPPFQVTATGLPAGITFNGSAFTGTANTPGTFPIVLQITTGSAVTTVNLNLVVTSPVTIVTTTLPNASLGFFYSQSIQATGGKPPYTFSLSPNSQLPAGLTLSPNGVISGVPTTGGTFLFTVQVADSGTTVPGSLPSRTFSIQVTSQVGALTIATGNLPDGRVNVPYVFNLGATGGFPSYFWSLVSGSLPAGLQLTSSGAITGTPSTAGSSQFTVQLTDGTQTTTSSLTLNIRPAALAFTAIPPQTIVAQSAYSQTLQVTGGAGAIAFSVQSGQLPPGVTLSGSTLSGTATTPGTFSFTILAKDASGTTATQSATVTVVQALAFVTISLNSGAMNSGYSGTLQATGGTPPYTFSLASGTLPAGISLSSAGVFSGTPTAVGTSTFTIQVSDSGGQTKTQQFTINILNALSITTASPLTSGVTGSAYQQALSAAGGAGGYTFQVVNGALPDGLNLAASGVLTGTPTKVGSFAFTVQVTDSSHASATKDFALTVLAPVTITPATLPGGVVGTAYQQSVKASGGVAPVSVSVSGGSLPPGLSLGADGTLAGTPTQAGSFTFTVKANDSGNSSATQSYTVGIALPPAPPFTTTGVPATGVPSAQSQIGVTLGNSYPVDVNGTVILTFAPNTVNGGDDAAIQFANHTRTLNFTVPAGQTAAVFTDLPGISFGTTAGTITLTFSLAAQGQPLPSSTIVQTITVGRSAPVISSVAATQTGTGVTITISGFSTPREVTSATFTFAAKPGSTLQSSTVTVNVAAAFASYYQGATASATGSQFVLTMPFTLQGTSQLSSVAVTLTNSVGTSNSVSANF